MSFPGGLQRNPFRFLITPSAIGIDLYYDLSLAPAAFWNYVRSDGGDIRVRTQDGLAPIPRELASFNFGAKTGSLFLKTGSGTAFYVYYGNRQFVEPAANDTYGKYNTWESSARYVAHLEDANDSSSNQYTGTATGTSVVAGKISNGKSFNGTTDIVQTAASPALGSASFTLSTWVKATAPANGAMLLMIGPQTSNNLTVYLTVNGSVQVGIGTWGFALTSYVAYASAFNNAWNLLTGVYTGGLFTTYLNGVAGTSGARSPNVQAGTIMVGNGTSSPFAGALDEVRIYSRALSQGEITIMYNNQSNPGAFWVTGGQEQV